MAQMIFRLIRRIQYGETYKGRLIQNMIFHHLSAQITWDTGKKFPQTHHLQTISMRRIQTLNMETNGQLIVNDVYQLMKCEHVAMTLLHFLVLKTMTISPITHMMFGKTQLLIQRSETE